MWPTSFEHHAYVGAGGRAEAEELRAHLIKEKVIAAQSPDLFVDHVDSCGVAEARALRERALLHPLENNRNIFIMSAGIMSADAQNILLKTFEEPASSQFFLFVLQPNRLLPTFRSRVQMLEGTCSAPDVSGFLSASKTQRLDQIKEMVGDDAFGSSQALVFLNAVETALAKKSPAPSAMRAVYDAKRYLTQTGASAKILLEHVALLV